MGYQYITTEEMANRSISLLDLEKMAAHNLQILTSYQKRTYKAQKELLLNCAEFFTYIKLCKHIAGQVIVCVSNIKITVIYYVFYYVSF